MRTISPTVVVLIGVIGLAAFIAISIAISRHKAMKRRRERWLTGHDR